MIEQDIFARLRDDAGVSALVAGRVFPVQIPQSPDQGHSKSPCVVFTLNSEARTPTVCDISSSVEGTYQMDSVSKSYFEAKAIAAAVRVCLNSFTGQMGGTAVDRVLLDTAQDLIETEPGLYRVSQTYVFYYQE